MLKKYVKEYYPRGASLSIGKNIGFISQIEAHLKKKYNLIPSKFNCNSIRMLD
jgi:hypothetical protein